MAVGIAMAQQMMQQQAGASAPPPIPGVAMPASAPAPAAPAAGTGLPELLSPADAAKALGVTEADVIQTIEAGELKARKIGSAYRITRAALDAFLNA